MGHTHRKIIPVKEVLHATGTLNMSDLTQSSVLDVGYTHRKIVPVKEVSHAEPCWAWCDMQQGS